MLYVYVLFSKQDQGLYIGMTSNIKQRIGQHKQGYVVSTKNRGDLLLIYLEFFINKNDAHSREKFLKSGYGRQQLKSIIKNTLQNLPKE